MNRKKFIEKRNTLVTEMEGLVNKATEEVRAFDEAENTRIAEIKKEIADIDATIKTIDETRELVKEEIKVFVEMINGKRALDVANNGAIIPETIANRIIEKVKELSPIVSMATVFNEGGNLKFPVYDETTAIEAAYVDDMEELTEQTGKFTTVSLQNYIVGSLAKISKSLANRTNTCAAGQTITGATAGKITADELIDLQLSVPQVYQAKACWIMNKADFGLIRKLKDGDGNYLMTKDYVAGFGYSLLGKTVYISENADAVYYGDMSGLYIKFAQTVEVQVLLEKYATQHAIGAVA